MSVIRITFDLETFVVARDDGAPVNVHEFGRTVVDAIRGLELGKTTFVESNVSHFTATDRARLIQWLNDPGQRDLWTKDDLALAIAAGLPWNDPRPAK